MITFDKNFNKNKNAISYKHEYPKTLQNNFKYG